MNIVLNIYFLITIYFILRVIISTYFKRRFIETVNKPKNNNEYTKNTITSKLGNFNHSFKSEILEDCIGTKIYTHYFYKERNKILIINFVGNSQNIKETFQIDYFFMKNIPDADIIGYNYLGIDKISKIANSDIELINQAKCVVKTILDRDKKYDKVILYGYSIGGFFLSVISNYIFDNYPKIEISNIIHNSFYDVTMLFPKRIIYLFTNWKFKNYKEEIEKFMDNKNIQKIIINSNKDKVLGFKNTAAYQLLKRKYNNYKFEIGKEIIRNEDNIIITVFEGTHSSSFTWDEDKEDFVDFFENNVIKYIR
jgi:hypothetical protein